MAIKIYSEDTGYSVADKEKFLKTHHLIVAAGGLIRNDKGELLLIFRRGKWDLPKGKLDEGETPEGCAAREIREETGVTGLQLEKSLLVTHHTYTEKEKEILKETHWFLFWAPGRQPLLPQTEEDIEKAEWVNPSELSACLNNTYALIKDVLAEAGVI